MYECLADGCGKSYGSESASDFGRTGGKVDTDLTLLPLPSVEPSEPAHPHAEPRAEKDASRSVSLVRSRVACAIFVLTICVPFAEFRDLRRLWRRKRKDQNAVAIAAQKAANGGQPKLGGMEKRPSNAGKSTAGGRRRSSASGLGDDDSDEEEEDDDDEQDDYSDNDGGSSGTNPPSSVPHAQPSVLVPSVFASYPPGTSSPQHTPTFAYDHSRSHSSHPNSTGHLSGPLSPLDPLLPFFSGGPPSSTSFSPAPTFSSSSHNITATPDFNQWAFSDPLTSSTPGSGGTPSYHRAGGQQTGFSPLTGLGVGGGEPPSPLEHQAISGLGRRGSRRRGIAGVVGVGTIEEVGEV